MSASRARRYFYAFATIALSSLLLIAAVWALVLNRVSFERGRVEAEAASNHARLALGFEEYTRGILGEVDHALTLVRRAYLSEGRELDLPRALRDGQVDERDMAAFVVLDERGALVRSAGRPEPGSRALPDYFPILRAQAIDRLHLGKPRKDSGGRWVLDLARRITGRDGSFAGVVAAAVDPTRFGAFFDESSMLGDDALVLAGTDGIERIRRTADKVAVGDDLLGSSLFKAMAASPTGAYVTRGIRTGFERFMSYRVLPDLPLVVAAGSSRHEAMGVFRSNRLDYFAIATLATIAVLVLAAFMARALVRQRRAVDALIAVARSEGQLRATFDEAFVGMSQTAPDGRPVQVNKTLCGMLGYSEEELLALRIDDLVHPEDRVAGARSGGGAISQKRLVRKDGGIVWANIATTVVRGPTGMPQNLVNVVQDISEFKRIDRMKSEFVSTVSHELRTPLTSIRGSLGLIAGGVAGPLPEAAKNLVDIARNNCERLIRLINDILDSEKLASGKMGFEIRDTALRPLVEQAIAANDGYAAQHGVKLSLDGPEDPLVVKVDADRLNQVLANLISNAVKFSPAGAVVDVRVSRAGERARVEVRDRGPGISEEFRGRIFQRFSQADSSDARQKGGTGLGLSISKAIVERLGGTMGFTTDRGTGSVFFFELPAVRPAPAAPAGAAERPLVLVCEDDPDVAQLICMMLDKAGYGTEIAHTAAEAKSLAAVPIFAAMTVDLKLPDEDGISLIRALRAKPHTRTLPLIVVSAWAEEGQVQLNGEVHAVSDWLSKPIDEIRLVRSVSRAVRGTAGRPRILHVEDDPDIRRVAATIAQDLASFEFAATLKEARALLSVWKFDLILLDLGLPDGSGWQLLRDIDALDPRPEVVVFSASDTSAEEAARVSAVLVKADTSNEQLLETIRRVLRRRAEHSRDAGHAATEKTTGGREIRE